MANRNTLWATVFVDELARSGLQAVVAAPGSRHTPLMLAFADHPDIRVYSHLDERSASFFALGLALASERPVALACSSGTAGANMYPAVIEAHQSRVPLIVLTADRPHELRHSGANQTIDQIKLFGDFALWFVDMALPEAQASAVVMRHLRTTANRAYATANGTRKGVVHLNFPFRKPLEPTPIADDVTDAPASALPRPNNTPFTHFGRVRLSGAEIDSFNTIHNALAQYENGIILCGGHTSGTPDTASALLELKSYTGYPIIAESTSGVRGVALGGGDYYLGLPDTLSADVILRFGDVPISNTLNQYIARSLPTCYVQVTPDGNWSDDAHLTTHLIPMDAVMFAEHLMHQQDSLRETSPLMQQLNERERITWEIVAQEIEAGAYFDGAVVYDVLEQIAGDSTLFAGNSLAVRHLDQFGVPQDQPLHIYANRGTSGIDGNVSTALGAGAGHRDHPLVAVMGDITFYHDMNGLLAVHRCGVPITLVILNNDGGGIFNRLPIKNFEPNFSDYFITAHGLDFSHSAKLYGLEYVRVEANESNARQTFREAFVQAQRHTQDKAISTLIEVRTDGRADEARRQAIMRRVRQALD
ncbi:MAG: 2-succinyl-5-enolpyruvyl-6-hydroxy-3-cyclohexene-1-carboxylic-acid synthase [Anaerolineae bacterium]